MPQISTSDVSRTQAYAIEQGTPVNNSVNSPQRIAVLAEMNRANQSTPLTPHQATSRQAEAALFGWGSPMDICLRILLANTQVAVWVYPQAEAAGATVSSKSITATGTATGNNTHTILIGGRGYLEGGKYDFSVVTGDTPATLNTKIRDVVNAVLGCPMSAAYGPNAIATTSLGATGSGGTGYAVNDTFTVSTGTTLATGHVTAISGGGGTGPVTTFTIDTGGVGYSVASSVATVATSGGGSGMTVNVLTVTVAYVALSSVWYGLTAEGISINILTNGNAVGMSYAVNTLTAGTGTPSVASAITSFGTDWNTIVLNSYGILSTGTNALCDAGNGNANTKTARFDPLVMEPAIYIVGSVTDATTTSADTAITDALKNEMTLAVAPAPDGLGLPMEAAANMVLNFANVSDTSPNTDVQAIPYIDMPGPLAGSFPTQSYSYTLRNALVKMGMSTVIYKDGQYFPQDFVTTYHPTGETNPAFMYPRDIMIDLNIRYKFTNLQNAVILNKQIAADADVVSAANVVKPKDVKAALIGLANDLVDQGFITNAAFMIASITVVINPANKNRFDIAFS